MAFKATRKTPVKSAKTRKPVESITQEYAEPAQESAPVISIDDLIGAPVKSVPEAPQTIEPQSEVSPADFVGDARPPVSEETPSQSPVTPSHQRYARPQYGQRNDRPRMGSPRLASQRSGFGGEAGFDRGGNRGGYQNFRRGGYNAGGGRFSPRGYDNGGRFGGNQGGYQREWNTGFNINTAQPHEQDINVPTETVRGILDCMPEGHGFLRPKFTPSERDVYISQSQIRRFMLRNGDMVEGQARQPKENERYWGLLKVEKVNEKLAEEVTNRPRFDDLVAIYPDRQLRLESGQSPLSTRIIDLIAPIGFGQRALIVSPPKAGKTTILKELAAGISMNYPNVHLMAALIGERPEEVTDLSRSIKGEVLASNFDESPQEQTRIAEVALDRAKRLVEMGKDVVVLLDSITRLARAYNLVVNPSGRTLSGGFDPAALYPGKKFLGAARCVEKTVTAPIAAPVEEAGETEKPAVSENATGTGGSLTVIGTALVDTGSRMDDMIYEEFKGTGNMELHLSRSLQERRVFPAIDVVKSGTRHDELLLGEEKMKKVVTLRHMLSLLGDDERTMMLVEKLSKTKSNDEFLDSLSQG